MQKEREEYSTPLPDLIDPELVEYASDRVIRHHGTGNQTGYKVRWYEYSVEDYAHEPSSELRISVVRRYLAARRRQKVTRSEKTGERTLLRQVYKVDPSIMLTTSDRSGIYELSCLYFGK